jgi:hypothetical protein
MLVSMARAIVLATTLAACLKQRPLHDVRELAGEEVIVKTTTEKFEATVAVDRDEITFRTPTGKTVRFDDVLNVQKIRRVRGALTVAALFAPVGIIAGAILGYTAGGDLPCPQGEACRGMISAPRYAAIGATAVGGLGAAIGLVLGYALGGADVYGDVFYYDVHSP